PWHGWEFDLESGVCPDDGRMRVAVYPVQVRDGRVLVEA
ncbi:MAG: Rieske-like [2Fe-2S] domain, partial [Gaiellales bacterium]|nr:Rieske-like [2Fe-2S] domain [Gaiellales bacterium]